MSRALYKAMVVEGIMLKLESDSGNTLKFAAITFYCSVNSSMTPCKITQNLQIIEKW